TRSTERASNRLRRNLGIFMIASLGAAVTARLVDDLPAPYRVADASERSDVCGRIPLKQHKVGRATRGDLPRTRAGVEALDGRCGEHGQDLTERKPRVLQQEILVGRIVVRHVAHVRPEDEL